MEIRKISKTELPDALELVWRVFLEFEGPDFSQEGIDEFRKNIDGQAENLTHEMFGAYEKDEVLGVIATRNEGSHVSLFFVKQTHHGQGIGKMLFQHIKSLCESDFITVNSSPYAVKIYRRLGFLDTDEEQLTNGIRYVPMKYIK